MSSEIENHLIFSVIATTLYGVFAYYVFPYNWSWSQSLLFGGIISNVDPVTVNNIVKDVSQGIKVLISKGNFFSDTLSHMKSKRYKGIIIVFLFVSQRIKLKVKMINDGCEHIYVKC